MIVPSIYVPTEISATGDHSGRRPAFVPGAAKQAPSVRAESLPAETRGSSDGVNNLSDRSLPESTVVAIDEGFPVDEGVRWPDELSETAFLAEQPTHSPPASTDGAPPKTTRATPQLPLPPLQELIDRIPAEARETLEDLFRARFVNVRYTETSECRSESALR